ncbi:AfsR/SARP family transcriptional regulator [Catellatospora sichuanensis]|uniref:AfsR/SARP family transcriptional regulator n=1 Tax=Catellatospora sichuanensis TaxID=1969805 RepID=UPI0016433D4A|nr:BTAD domain-containing putative transcriptional regulator [Catellatospora sichuanensis]
MITFGVLGPLAVHREGQPVELPAAMLRRLLAVLLSRANQPISADRLADTLWDGSPPATARKTLQVYVHRLRTALGDPARVAHGPGGYRIAATAAELDSLAFADLLGQARAARRAGDDPAAADLFERALLLWRAEPYADLPADALLAEDVQRLSEEHLRAREESLGLRLDLGGQAEAVPELAALAAANPYRESLLALLMLALYRAGRRADALEVFRAAGVRLADELGIDAGAALRRLHAAVLRDDPHLTGVRVSELDTLAYGGAVAGTHMPTVPAQLPADTPVFSGRADELRRLDDLLPDTPTTGLTTVVISAISGTAGVGKTTLAVRWAHRIADRFPDGQLYLNLRGYDSAGTALSTAEAVRGFLDALAVPPHRMPTTLDGQLGLYRSLLAGKRVLVVLDNVRDAEHVRPLLPGSPGCLVLVTSRQQLPALVVTEGARPLTLGLLDAAEARELLSRRLGRDRLSTEPAAVDEIVRICGGLPLALAVVAAKAATSPDAALGELAAQLRAGQEGLDALAGWDAATNVRAVFSWSYRSLPDPAARMFRLLGLHTGPDLTPAAAASLAAVPVAQAREALDTLAQAHLVTEGPAGRFGSHDLLKAYAAELAMADEPPADRHAASRRLLDHYLHTAFAAARLLSPHRDTITLAPIVPGVRAEEVADHAAALGWFTAEHPVLLACIRQAGATEAVGDVGRFAWTVQTFLDYQGRWHDLTEIHHLELAAALHAGDQGDQGKAHRGLALVLTRQSRLDEAHEHYGHALRLYAAVGDQHGQAHIHRGIGWALEREGRWREALGHAEQALELFRAAGHRYGEARALNAAGWDHAQLGEYGHALTRCGQALAILEELGDRNGQAATWDSLGKAHHHLGAHDEADRCFQQALGLVRQSGDRFNEAGVLDHIGDSRLAAGDPERARQAWQQAVDILTALGNPEAERVSAKLPVPTAAR